LFALPMKHRKRQAHHKPWSRGRELWRQTNSSGFLNGKEPETIDSGALPSEHNGRGGRLLHERWSLKLRPRRQPIAVIDRCQRGRVVPDVEFAPANDRLSDPA